MAPLDNSPAVTRHRLFSLGARTYTLVPGARVFFVQFGKKTWQQVLTAQPNGTWYAHLWAEGSWWEPKTPGVLYIAQPRLPANTLIEAQDGHPMSLVEQARHLYTTVYKLQERETSFRLAIPARLIWTTFQADAAGTFTYKRSIEEYRKDGEAPRQVIALRKTQEG